MAKRVIDKRSPYADTPVKEFYLGLYVDRAIPPSDDDELVEVESKYKHRPDMFSYDLYGTSRYWWIFMRRNMNSFQDPIFDLEPGMEIYVPTKERLERLFN